jgi:hypothetical protein
MSGADQFENITNSIGLEMGKSRSKTARECFFAAGSQ